jgi:predicted PurR-regulated permease PerM
MNGSPQNNQTSSTQTILPILPGWQTHDIIQATVVVVLIGLAFWLLYQLRLVVFMAFVAIVIGTALKPVTRWLHQRWRVPPVGGVILVYLLLLGLVGLLLWATPPLFSQASAIVETLPDYYQDFRRWLISSPNLMLQQIAWRLPPEMPTGIDPPVGGEPTGAVTGNNVSLIEITFKSIFTAVATLMLSFYWTLNSERMIRSLLFVLPFYRREGAEELIQAMEQKVGAYVRGQIILCVIIGALALAAYLWIGLPNALLLALIAGLMEAIPYIGPVLGAIPPLIVATSMGSSTVTWVIIATLIIQQFENTILVPRIMDKSVGVNPIVTLLAFFTFGTLMGVPGALLAVPIAAILQLLVDRYLRSPVGLDQQTPVGRDQVSAIQYELRQLLEALQRHSRFDEEAEDELLDDYSDRTIEEEIEAIAVDLDSLLAQTRAEEVAP